MAPWWGVFFLISNLCSILREKGSFVLHVAYGKHNSHVIRGQNDSKVFRWSANLSSRSAELLFCVASPIGNVDRRGSSPLIRVRIRTVIGKSRSPRQPIWVWEPTDFRCSCIINFFNENGNLGLGPFFLRSVKVCLPTALCCWTSENTAT